MITMFGALMEYLHRIDKLSLRGMTGQEEDMEKKGC